MTHSRKEICKTRRWVIKIGSSLLSDLNTGLRVNAIKTWVAQIAQLRQSGVEVVIVSSGAVAAGMSRLNWQKRPVALHKLQAAAAVGQMGLIQAYESAFQKYDTHTAQVLLTHADVSNKDHYMNARSTLRTLIHLGVVPIINENDTVATEEIRFSDNDTLAAHVVNLIGADLLLILTDQYGLYTSDPRQDDAAKLITIADASNSSLQQHAGKIGTLGRGGMQTKINAAATSAQYGAHTVIASGLEDNVISDIATAKEVGTFLWTSLALIAARKHQLIKNGPVTAWLTLKTPAVNRLKQGNTNIFLQDLIATEGCFKRGDLVSCLDADGLKVALGLINYGTEEVQRLIQQSSAKNRSLLNNMDEEELIHWDNIVLNIEI